MKGGKIAPENITASMALQSDASKNIESSSVTSTELGYVSGVTSSIQTQINGKASSGVNSDITSMTGLDDDGIPLAKVDDAASATTLSSHTSEANPHSGSASSGVNSDITSTTALTSISNSGDITISSTGAGVNINTHSDSGDDFAVNTDALIVEGDTGNVGIGTTSPVSVLHATRTSGTNYLYMNVDSLSSGNYSAIICRGKGGLDSARAAELGTIYYDQSGTGDGGSNNAVGYVKLAAGDGVENSIWVDNANILRISSTSTYRGSTHGAAVGDQSSDIRLKSDVEDCEYGLDEVLKLTPIKFKYKDTSETRLGFSAQDTESIIPEIVYNTGDFIEDETGEEIELQPEETDDEGNIIQEKVVKIGKLDKRAMRYPELTPVLVNSDKQLYALIQKQQATIEALQSTIEALEARIEALENK